MLTHFQESPHRSLHVMTPAHTILAILLSMLLVNTAGCVPVIDNPQLPVVVVSEKDTGATIDLGLRQQLIIRLGSNRTTGFEWLLVDLTGQVMKAVGEVPVYENSSNPGELMGLGGAEKWTFRPVKTGESLVRFECRRPWENGREAIRSAVFRVRVK